MKPRVIVVGADKGGVGKTTVSRVMLDYFTNAHLQPRAFDTEKKETGVLKRFHPSITEIVDFSKVDGQMRVLDSLKTSPLTLIDCRANLLLDSLDTLANIGFLDKVKNGEITIQTFHVLDGSVAALDEVADAAKILNNEGYYVVRNHINDRAFFSWSETRSKIAGTVVDVPKLDERASEAVDDMGVSFEEFISKTDSDVLRGYVKHWKQKVYAVFDGIGLSKQ
jgi:hypothetical protein